MKDQTGYYARYYQSTRRDMLPYLPHIYSRVLEIGCAEGYFAENLRPCEYWGVELEDAVATKAREKLTRVLTGSFEECYNQLPDHYFDLVVVNDVIEHMDDPDRFLKAIKTKLVPNGSIVGSVPNVRYVNVLFELLVLKDWRYRDAGVLDRTHQRFFTEKSLRRSLRDNGFQVEVIEGLSERLYRPRSVRVILKDILILPMIVASFGFYSDIRFLRYAFRVRPVPQDPCSAGAGIQPSD